MENALESIRSPAGYNQPSTVEFPYCDLDNAVELAKGVHTSGGLACDIEQLAAQLKMEAKGGGFRVRINGARIFGFIVYERGGRITLTELGRRVIDDNKERAARVDAFLSVELYQKVYDKYRGSPLPTATGFERSLVDLGVGDGVKDKARQVLMRSAKQAGFFELAQDRLTKPSVRGDQLEIDDESRHKKEEVTRDDPVNSLTLDGARNHPLIQGLLMTLPLPNTEWTSEERMNWLKMAHSIFKMIYVDLGNDDITIQLLKNQGGSISTLQGGK